MSSVFSKFLCAAFVIFAVLAILLFCVSIPHEDAAYAQETPYPLRLPVCEDLIAGLPLSCSELSDDHVFSTEGRCEWVEGDKIMEEAGEFEEKVVFIPDDEDNYERCYFSITIRVYYLKVVFNSHNSIQIIEASYGQNIPVSQFPQPADKEGYSKAWDRDTDIENITEDMEINAVYTLNQPQVFIEGYEGEVTYDPQSSIVLTAAAEHPLGNFSYKWYLGEEFISNQQSVTVSQVSQSGVYSVTVTVDDGQQSASATASQNVTINKAQAEIQADSVQIFTYDGDMKTVEASLNHNETELIYDGAQGYVDANEDGYLITITALETANYLAPQPVQVRLIINKADIDVSQLSFDGQSFEYDGQQHFIYVTGELPQEIAAIEYENNGKVNAGEYQVSALFEYDWNNYNEVLPMTALLTISKRTVYITIHDKTSVYGQPLQELTCDVMNKVEGDDLNLTLIKEGGVNAGFYAIRGEIDNPNYQADFTNGVYHISKAVINMEEVSFNDKEVIYNAKEQAIAVSGDLPQEITDVIYASNKGVNAGSYEAKAEFVYDQNNYQPILPLYATLTILPRPVTATFYPPENSFYDGQVKEIRVELNNIPKDEKQAVTPVITYDKQVILPDYYTASISLDNPNYVLTGVTEYNFIIYLESITSHDDSDGIVAEVISSDGFLPGSQLQADMTIEEKDITSGGFKGMEIKQVFDITFEGEGEAVADVKLLIAPKFRHLKNLKVGVIDENGQIVEVQSVRKGDYMEIKAQLSSHSALSYVILGEGKGDVAWVIYALAGGGAIIVAAALISAAVAKRRSKLRKKIIGR